ncbi:MAG: hypothetical protein WBC22_04320 [Sedimentisphaerales bacterium]
MRCRILSLVFFQVVGCTFSGCHIARQQRPRILTFPTWDSAVEFLQWRHLIPAGDREREQCKRDSIIRTVKVQGYEFYVIALDWRGGSKHGIRGQNVPMYVLRRQDSHYMLVGGFLGSRLDVVEDNDAVVALVSYHVSASEVPIERYSLRGDVFNYIDPTARGDVFK